MRIMGFDKLTLLNYPDKVACTIFTSGCNFKCPFCQNSSLIEISDGIISEDEIFKYLNKRKGILDGVCISGGEPLMQKDIKQFIEKIKDLGYLVKLDTNGSNPVMLKTLIDEKLIDYVAMDIKNVDEKYTLTSGIDMLSNIKKSIDIIENSGIEYEFRTTIVKEFHTIDDIKKIRKMIKGKYYVQNFVDSDGVLEKGLHGFTTDELYEIKKKAKDVLFRDI